MTLQFLSPDKIGKLGGGGYFSSLALTVFAALFVILPANTLGQIWVDGIEYTGYVNENGNTITDVIINEESRFWNQGNINGTVRLNGNGIMQPPDGIYLHNGLGGSLAFPTTLPTETIVADNYTGYIYYADIHGGQTINGGGGYVNLNVFPSLSPTSDRNYTGGNGIGHIGTVDIYDGLLGNGAGGNVMPSRESRNGDANTITGGDGTGTIDTVNVYDGAQVHNGVGGGHGSSPPPASPRPSSNVFKGGDGTGIIGTANIHSGMVVNGSVGTTLVESPQDVAGVGTGTITTANVYEKGILNNSKGSMVDTANLEGGTINNGGRIEELNYRSGTYNGEYNGNTGSIGTLNISTDVTDMDWGGVWTVNVHEDGVFDNTRSPGPLNVTVSGGTFNNVGGGWPREVTVESGVLNNQSLISTAEMNGSGTIINDNGSIAILTVNGGELHNKVAKLYHENQRKTSVGTLTLNNGNVINYGTTGGGIPINDLYDPNDSFNRNGIIYLASMSGGTLENGGLIGELTYIGGEYRDNYEGQSGRINTLILAGDSTGTEWGLVQNVVFASDGSGILSIKAIASTPEPAMQNFAAFSATAAEVPTNITFSIGMSAENIDLTDGNLVFDFSNLEGVNSNVIISAFEEDILGMPLSTAVTDGDKLRSVTVLKNEAFDVNSALEVMESIAASLEENYGFVRSSDGPVVIDEGNRIVLSAAVPEPATLVMLTLGLAGLGLARRRK